MKNKKIAFILLFLLLFTLMSCTDTGSQHKHVYNNKCDATCNDCGEIRVVPHNYEYECDSICNTCGEERVTEHLYDDNCDS